ncbi:hypothetical protein NDU88_006372 [Pleurodeles waltl]|uniref:Uncharacterized protein n=1 Tax=Pleurodeles waltl TaxID=8319 RepID=A0AAV7ULA5_PLEWA|nr:hypothetical protein NDU88_006372 [Pleurodeles waltl]
MDCRSDFPHFTITRAPRSHLHTSQEGVFLQSSGGTHLRPSQTGVTGELQQQAGSTDTQVQPVGPSGDGASGPPGPAPRFQGGTARPSPIRSKSLKSQGHRPPLARAGAVRLPEPRSMTSGPPPHSAASTSGGVLRSSPEPCPSNQATSGRPRAPRALRECGRAGRRLTSGRSGTEAATRTGPGRGPKAVRSSSRSVSPQRQGGGTHWSEGLPFLQLRRRSSAAVRRPQRSGPGQTAGRISGDSWCLRSASRGPSHSWEHCITPPSWLQGRVSP